jgi:hypothetical protein
MVFGRSFWTACGERPLRGGHFDPSLTGVGRLLPVGAIADRERVVSDYPIDLHGQLSGDSSQPNRVTLESAPEDG